MPARMPATAVEAARRLDARRLPSLAAVASAVVVVRSRKKIGLPAGVATAAAFAAVPALTAGFKRSVVRDAAAWALQMWAYKNAFEMPNDDEPRLRARAHFDYPLAIDSRLGRGTPPNQRLQVRLRRRGELSAVDKALSFFYWTWEAEPHLALLWIRCKRPDSFASAAGRLASTFDLTLLGYWLLPTAPPWWVSEKLGRMDGTVRRVMSEVASWMKREPNPTEGDHEIGANPFAAMPSDHFASAAMTAIVLSDHGRIVGAVAWSYAFALAFALVYLGEHYVVDELAGLALALAVDRARQPCERLAATVLALSD
jgi:membrane-associated phospholipid phosphatase